MQSRDYDKLIADIRRADAGPFLEVAQRFIIICAAAALFSYRHEDPFIFGALLLYCVIHFFYSRSLQDTRIPASSGRYLRLFATAIGTTLLYDATVIYLWHTNDALCMLGAIAALGGQANFTLARHNAIRDFAIADAIMIGATAMTIGLLLGLENGEPAFLVGVIFISAMVTGHFVWNLYNRYQEEMRLVAAEATRAREERLKTIGQLTAGVAHDFNNTLTAVLGHLELYAYTDDIKEQRASVLAARLAADRAVDLTQQLLAYARKAPLEQALHDIAPIIEEVASDYHSIFGDDPDRPLIVDIGSDLKDIDPFWVDGCRLQSAIGNLLRNATEAISTKGEIILSVSFDTLRRPAALRHGTTLAPGKYIAFSVTDNGDGIAAEDMAHVTEPFWTTKSHANGSGLGLAMVQGFAEQSGGGLDMCSRSGKGTVASLHLRFKTQ